MNKENSSNWWYGLIVFIIFLIWPITLAIKLDSLEILINNLRDEINNSHHVEAITEKDQYLLVKEGPQYWDKGGKEMVVLTPNGKYFYNLRTAWDAHTAIAEGHLLSGEEDGL